MNRKNERRYRGNPKKARRITGCLVNTIFSGSIMLSSCGMINNQEFRVNPEAMETFSAKELGLVKGETTAAALIDRMKQKGMTGITTDDLVHGKHYQAVSADYQKKIDIFEQDSYSHSVRLDCNSIPYDLGIRFGSFRNRLFLLVMYGDPISLVKNRHGLTPQPPKLEVFKYQDNGFSKHEGVDLKRLSERNMGLRDPFFVSWNLEDGILFLARDDEGTAWRKAYYIRMIESDQKGPSVRIGEPVSLRQALECSCVQEYIYGE